MYSPELAVLVSHKYDTIVLRFINSSSLRRPHRRHRGCLRVDGVACGARGAHRTRALGCYELVDNGSARVNSKFQEHVWAANGAFTGRTSGTSDQTFSAFRVHTTGISTLVSANTSGNVVGITILPLSGGQFGANLNVTIDIAR